ncbi:MAG: hypothetical protein E6J26_05270 [Chloroflexi bacterium]|nr:MAG: hypothetical protein E6J26_05270 [Chloroflexota bacterium]
MNFLDQIPIVSTVPRNHGVEHATIHVLASRLQNLSLVGHATLDGFNLYGEVEADQVESAANEALRRLRAGDSRLVIHPNCGTNFATAGMLAGIAAWLASYGKDSASKLPRIIMASTVALIFALPLGLSVQEYVTTSPLVGEARVLGVERSKRGSMTVHRVRLSR